MTKERLEEIERRGTCKFKEWEEILALALRGLEAEAICPLGQIDVGVEKTGDNAAAVDQLRGERSALLKLLAKEKDDNAALAAVGMPVEEK